MISKSELDDEEIYEELYNYMSSKGYIQKRKDKFFKTKIKELNDKSSLFNEIKQVFIIIGGIGCISLHIILLLLKLF